VVLDREGEKSKEASPIEEVIEPIFSICGKAETGAWTNCPVLRMVWEKNLPDQ